MHATPHPLAGKTVALALKAEGPGLVDATEFWIENWWDALTGGSWMFAGGNWAAAKYAMRSALASLPIDNEVVYGKTKDGLGHLVHTSELGEEIIP